MAYVMHKDGLLQLICMELDPYRSSHINGGHRMTPLPHALVIRWSLRQLELWTSGLIGLLMLPGFGENKLAKLGSRSW